MPAGTISQRLASVWRMLHDVSLAETPQELLQAFGERWIDLFPTDYYISLSVRGLEAGQFKITRRLDLRLAPSEAMERFRRANPWRNWDRLPVQQGGFLSEVIAEPVPQVFSDLDLRDDPVLGSDLGHLRSAIASPLFDRGEAMNWAINLREDPHGYDETDLEQAFISANLVGTSTRALLALTQNRELSNALTRQFEQVAQVQRSLLPQQFPEIPGVRIATSYLPSLHAGGDSYDFFPFSGGRWGAMIADVAGHGAAAATVMAMLHALLPHVDEPLAPDESIRTINRRLTQTLRDGVFVTACFVLLDPEGGTVEYVRCGHNPPRLRRAGGAVEALEEGACLPLGLSEPYELDSSTIRIQPGDALVLYTDGISEARNAQGEMFGTDRLDAAIAASDPAPAEIIDGVHRALVEFTGSRTRDDDQTMVVLAFEDTP